MDFSNIWQNLDVIVFGDQREHWAAADDAGKADLLREQGLHEVSPADVAEAVAYAYNDMPPHQAALLAPVNQVANVDVDVPGPGPAPAPAPTSGGGAPVPPPVDPELDPVQQLVQNVDFYVSNVSTNLDQSVEDNSHTEIDDRDTAIDNSTDVGMINNLDLGGFLGDHHDGGGSGVTFDNDVQSAGDDAIQIGEDAFVGRGAQLNTGDGAVQNQGPGDVNAITGDVSDSTIVQGDGTVGGNVTGDVGDGAIVNDGGDLTGVNTGSVGGNMVTADDHSAAAGGDQAIGNFGPVSQGEGDAIQSHGGNVNTGEGDQTNIDFNQHNFGGDSGGDVNFNIGDGTQTVLDNETDIDASTHVSDSVIGSENVAQADGHGDAIANDEGNVANDAFQIADNEVLVDHSVDNSQDFDVQLGLAGGDLDQDIVEAAPEPAPAPPEPAMDDIAE